MNRTWKSLSPRQQAVAKGTVEALTSIDGWMLPGDSVNGRQVTFRDLLAWVRGSDPLLSNEVRRAVAKEQRLARDLERLLRRTAGWYGARAAAAASSGTLDVREGNGFRLRLKTSRAGSGQVYLIIDLTDDRQPTSMVLHGPLGEYVKMALPAAQDGVIQVLTDGASEEIRLLRDPETELFLW
ncbi:MAG: hypothetical protein ABT940_06930 [Alphaproteobacteria bacterium]